MSGDMDLTAARAAVERIRSMPETIGADLEALGGFLCCGACGEHRELGDVASHLSTGWPECCGYTMTWWTQRQIDAGEAPAARSPQGEAET